MLVKVVVQLLIDEAVDDSLNVGVSELHLGLTFELRVGDLYGNDCTQTLTDI